MKRTRSQAQILSLLEQTARAISAQDLHMELRSRDCVMGLATVYRALEALKLDGSVQVRTLTNGEALYSLTQEDRHHLTCLRCGKSLPIDECPVHELEERLDQDHRFKVYYHTLEFFGLCAGCQSGDASSKS
ncbi:MAG: Fur family transcriptional regulator [Elainellaceae cyanobacterium]